ncbi:MAG: virginiamycin lyase, partial [Solirubrobacteraceae bacterium]|nr:virginiamycin lyase [Solirubrobacteraceae bacterium]
MRKLRYLGVLAIFAALALPQAAAARMGCFVGIDVSRRDERSPSACVRFPVPEIVAGPIARGPGSAVTAFALGYAYVVSPNGASRRVELGRFAGWAHGFPDNSVWFSTFANDLGRIDQSGRVEFVPTPYLQTIGEVAEGADGSIWFAAGPFLGRLVAGTLKAYYLGGLRAEQGLVTGPDGAMWFAAGEFVGRVDPNGGVRAFPAGGLNADGGVTNADGAVWFTDSGGMLGRITPDGAVTPFSASGRPRRITTGPDNRNVWYATDDFVGRMTTRSFSPADALRMRCDPVQRAACPYGYRTWPAGNVSLFYALSPPTGIVRGADRRIYSIQGGTVTAIEPYRGILLCGTHPRTTSNTPGVQGACGRNNPTFAVTNSGSAYVRLSCPRLTFRFCAGSLSLYRGSTFLGKGYYVIGAYDNPTARVVLNSRGRVARQRRIKVRGVVDNVDQGGLRSRR